MQTLDAQTLVDQLNRNTRNLEKYEDKDTASARKLVCFFDGKCDAIRDLLNLMGVTVRTNGSGEFFIVD